MNNLGRRGNGEVLGLQNELYSSEPYQGGAIRKIREYTRSHVIPYLLGLTAIAQSANYTPVVGSGLATGAAVAAASCSGSPTAPPPVVDMCPNIGGNQPNIPANMIITDGNCVCGPGYVQDSVGNCVQPGKVSISGSVKDRIEGGPIDNSTITYRGPDTKSATIIGGSYQISDLTPGNYDVTIEGGSHVRHETQVVPVLASGAFPFSVSKWGSGMFGAVYDARFDNFFNIAARAGTLAVGKWKQMPSEIYVTEEGLSPDKFSEFMDILNEVNNESTSKYFCGRTGPLPIHSGPVIGDRKDGSEVVRFNNSGSSTGRYTADGNIQGVGEVVGVKIDFYIPDFMNFDRAIRKYIINKELISAAWASDAPNTYDDSATASVTSVTKPSKEDMLAACIVYSDDTHPRNKSPDTNPTYK